YTVSADKKSYTYTLRDKITFSDGTPITTDDVKFTFDNIMDPKSDAAPTRAYWEGVKLEIKDKRTFTFTVPSPKFDTLRSFNYFNVQKKKQWEGESDSTKAKAVMAPIGTGPYKVTAFQRDQRVELERDKNWWGFQTPAFKNIWNADKIVYRIVTDPT